MNNPRKIMDAHSEPEVTTEEMIRQIKEGEIPIEMEEAGNWICEAVDRLQQLTERIEELEIVDREDKYNGHQRANNLEEGLVNALKAVDYERNKNKTLEAQLKQATEALNKIVNGYEIHDWHGGACRDLAREALAVIENGASDE